MKKATTTPDGRKEVRVIEIATVCAVLGILVSLAVPTLMPMRARVRMDHLLASAKSCREELPRWLSNTSSIRPAAPPESAGRAGAMAEHARRMLEEYARTCNERFARKRRPGSAPPLVVEPAGTPPATCSRDGRIHLIPSVDPDGPKVGATLVVTDEGHNGGPASDGILAVYHVAPGGR